MDGTWSLHVFDGERGQPAARLHEPEQVPPGFPAEVPGEVHLALIKAGLLAEPANGLNSLHARWVENAYWSWRREFLVEDATDTRAPVWLVFSQLSGAAEVFLNGTRIGGHQNDFRPARFEVSRALRPGRNVLVVQMEAGLIENTDKAGSPYHKNIAASATKRMWARKPQCQFSWDWAPRLLNVGVGGGVTLECTDTAVRLDQVVPLINVAEDLRHATVRVRAWIENVGEIPAPVELIVSMERLGIEGRVSAEVPPGLHAVETEVSVENPTLWWPRGHGDPHLEPLATFVLHGGTLVGHDTAQIGFRRVTIDESPHPDGGHFFTLQINNRPVFCKGANLVPPDLIFCRADAARYAGLLDRAEELHFNFLRVWGGGVYECDALYREADRRGFLVWQDFIYACSKYPLHEQEFFDEAVREATYQVRRLARHPSLVVWCGNNELETAQWSWGWEKWGVRTPDHGFFHVTLPKLMAAEDPTRFYWPSSPYSRNAVNPGSDLTGDQHPWAIGFFDTDFRGYRTFVSRFPNEGGILGPPSLPTLMACLPEGHQTIGSFAWQHHDNSVASWAYPTPVNLQIRQWTGRNMDSLSLREYVYYGGLVQGEGLREYIENFRRRMFSSASAVFWMFNDTWPTVRSWVPVDYALRRAPCFSFVRRAMAPVAVAIVEEGGHVRVFGLNDTLQTVRAHLRFGLFHTCGGDVQDTSAPVELAPNSATELASFDAALWTSDTAQVAFAVLTNEGGVLARTRLVRPFLAELEWAEPAVDIRVDANVATFESAVFVWGICLDLDGETPLADNFFDLYPGQSYAIPWTLPEPPKILFTGNRPLRGREEMVQP